MRLIFNLRNAGRVGLEQVLMRFHRIFMVKVPWLIDSLR